MTAVIQPGSTIGVFGSGQLGRMFTIAARRLGYRVHVFSPDNDTPAGQVADVEVLAPYDDLAAVAKFVANVSAVTFEFENVPVETIRCAEQVVPVRPAGRVLHVTQNRLREKEFLHSAQIPVTPFHAIQSAAALEDVPDDLFPGVLKTAAWGYDGKGQVVVQRRDELCAAWEKLQCDQAVLEQFVDFEAELSIVGVRAVDGDFRCYGPIANTHRNHILDLSVVPGGFPPRVDEDAAEIARTIMNELDVVGVLCVEFFLTKSGQLLVNELAPRPHNSGHLTIEAFTACQFEQQVRAVSNLPLAKPTLQRPAAMVNLLGDLWQNGTPNWPHALAVPDVKLHIYGKRSANPGRKMGHLTALAESPEIAIKNATAAREALSQTGEVT